MSNIDEDLVLAHFIVSDDVERSRRFYAEVLGGRLAFSGPGGLTYVALSNSWIIINGGGGPTDDKPSVTLETPRDPDRVSSFLNIRVEDIEAVYAEWSAGAQFPDAAETAPVRDPLLHPRPRRTHHRSRTNHRPRRRLDARHWPSSTPPEGLVLTRFIVSEAVERSRRFYTEVLTVSVVFLRKAVRRADRCPRVATAPRHKRRRRPDRRREPRVTLE